MRRSGSLSRILLATLRRLTLAFLTADASVWRPVSLDIDRTEVQSCGAGHVWETPCYVTPGRDDLLVPLASRLCPVPGCGLVDPEHATALLAVVLPEAGVSAAETARVLDSLVIRASRDRADAAAWSAKFLVRGDSLVHRDVVSQEANGSPIGFDGALWSEPS